MTTIFLFFIFLLIVFLQTTVFSFLGFVAKTNLVTITCLLLVFFRGFNKSWKSIIILGIIIDMLSALPFGLISLSLITAAFFVDILKRFVFLGSGLWVKTNLFLLGTLIYRLTLTVLANIFQFKLGYGWQNWILEAALSIVVGCVIIYAIQKIFHQKAGA